MPDEPRHNPPGHGQPEPDQWGRDRSVPAAEALARLQAWRDRASTTQHPGIDTVRNIHLSMVARSGRVTAASIAEILPASLKSFAPAMAQALARSGATPPDPPAGTPAGRPAGTLTGTPEPRPLAATSPSSEGVRQTAPDTRSPDSLGGPADSRDDPSNGVGGRAGSGGPPGSDPIPAPAPVPRDVAETARRVDRARPTDRPAPATGEEEGDGPGTAPDQAWAVHQSELARRWDDFAPLDYSALGGEPARIRANSAAGGAIRLRWPAWEEDPHTIYRVVSGDDYAPYDPQHADYLALTTGTECLDPRPFTSAIRHLQVWRNAGRDHAEAQSAQPVLHAQLPVVSPIQDLDLREDEGRVIGQWTTFPGVGRVQIYRVPIERAHQSIADPQHRILADAASLGGFVDSSAERGKRYVYQFLCEAEHDGLIRVSAAVTRPLLVQAVLVGVDDLTIRLHGSDADPQFDLTWTDPPAGRVMIFRTEAPPRPGSAAQVHEQSVLPQMNLPDEARLVHPVVMVEGQAAMEEVPWPRQWVRTYFTPVTVLDGRVQVGRSIPAVRTRGVTEPVVVERTHTQVLTFGWPTGAAEVSVVLGARGQPAEQLIDTAARIDISAKDYERFGGLQFSPPLPGQGCSIHMVGVSYSAGERVESVPVSIDYPGLLRLSYAVEQRRGMLGRGSPTLLIRIAAEIDLPHAPPFLLIFNDDRFPLDKDDGEALEVVTDDQLAVPVRRFVPPGLGPQWSAITWRAAVQRPGYVRLFLDLPPERLQSIALLDPDVDALIIRG